MRFYTKEESLDWLSGRGKSLPDRADSGFHLFYPLKDVDFRSVASWVADSLTFRSDSLLFVTEWGIWPSSENWHLYYKLRQSYGDQRLLNEAPGHLFLSYETEDLASFLQVAMLNGWGGYVMTAADYVNVFFSHDEYIDFFAEADENLADTRKRFANIPTKDESRLRVLEVERRNDQG